MDKNAIKKYAVWARRELLARVSQKALQYGVSEKDCGDINDEIVNGHLLTGSEKRQRQSLIHQIQKDGYQQVIEAVAYTWFNRFSALRFMEVNGYLPSHVRVFTDEQNTFKPQILTEAIHLDIDGLDMEKVYAMKDANKTDELYKYLLITQCNALGAVLPGMFTRIEDYTELLFPDNLLREGSVIEQMITLIPQEEWTDQVQIIGWLYQYYNAEPKDKVFADLKKNIKISKENIPAATQLFTPDWIVRYMVENSLGRLWVEHNIGNSRGDDDEIPGDLNEHLISKWKYYLFEAEQEPEVQAQLAEIRKEYATLKPEDIKCIDPCMGSGHILVYLVDVLMQIYEAYGYTSREAVVSILQNNLYGLDIDDRAAQLAYFAVMMKARQYDRRIFSRGIQPHVYAIVESQSLKAEEWEYLGEEKDIAYRLIQDFKDAKEYGSILQPDVTLEELEILKVRLAKIEEASVNGNLFVQTICERIIEALLPMIEQATVFVQKYHVVVTNPPYMGSSGMSAKLSEFVKKNYPDSKSDLFAVFIERCGMMCSKNGFQAMITQHAWMFLSSFEKLREKLMKKEIINMAHLGARAFEEIGGEVVQTTAFVLRQSHTEGYQGTYCRLIEPTTQQGKEDMFLTGENRYTAQQDNFTKIPGSPVAYWVSEAFYNIFTTDNIAPHFDVKAGMCTGENERFILQWFEVDSPKISINTEEYLYTPHNKGGEYRKWYGNRDCILKYNQKALSEMEHNAGFRHDGKEYYFKHHIGWSKITSSKSSFRFFEDGFTFDSAGLGLFSESANYYSTLALLNSKVVEYLLAILNPTLNVTPLIVKKLPYVDVDIGEKVQKTIALSKSDWDSFETSWDFKRHPLV